MILDLAEDLQAIAMAHALRPYYAQLCEAPQLARAFCYSRAGVAWSASADRTALRYAKAYYWMCKGRDPDYEYWGDRIP